MYALAGPNKDASEGMKRELFVLSSKQHGGGPVMQCWHPDGLLLSTTGQNKVVHIFDRSGALVDEISLAAPCQQLDWAKDGDLLAISQQESNSVLFWDKNSRKTTTLDTNLKESVSFIAWSKVGPQLAIGTTRGNLLIYNKKTQRKTPTIARHTKAITTGAWNGKNYLALGGEDKQITVTTHEGEPVEQTVVKSEPLDIMFSEMKADKKSQKTESTISLNLGRKTIYLYNLTDRDNPIELAFQPKYGTITAYRWFGDGYMMLGFSEGYFVVISTHMKEIGQELFSSKLFNSALTDICFSAALKKTAVCGDNTIKVVDVGNWKSVTDTFMIENEVVDKLSWTKDGTILSVSTESGAVYNFLTKIPMINAVSDTRWSCLASLRAVSVVDSLVPDRNIVIDLDFEPLFVALGPLHVSVGVNNHAWFYKVANDSQAMVAKKEYLGTVERITINQVYAAALLQEGRVQLHGIEPSVTQSKLFPEKEGDEASITCCELTKDFLIYGTSKGVIVYFSLSDWTQLSEYKHDKGLAIKGVWPNPTGSRIVFVDANNDGYIYSPVSDDQLVQIPKFPITVSRVMWDSADAGVFVVADLECEKLYTYTFHAFSTTQAVATQIATSKPAERYVAVLTHNGVFTAIGDTGLGVKITLASHEYIAPPNTLTVDKAKKAFNQCLALGRLKDCWELSMKCKDKDLWSQLCKQAMMLLDIDTAINVYRQVGDAAMVLALHKLRSVEEKHLLAGHISLLLQDYQQAEYLFLQSSRPQMALEMRRDLLHWEQALKLAAKLNPETIPILSKEYALQLEGKGDWKKAIEMYSKGVTGANDEQDRQCTAGIIRMTLRLGDTQKGISMCLGVKDKTLYRECAAILESMKQYAEAAALYERGGVFEKAVTLYLQVKNHQAAGALIDKVTSPKLHGQYGKLMEEQRRYPDAEKAYSVAKEIDSVIRLNLEFLGNPEKAFNLARETRSPEGARLVAKFCQSKIGDFKTAIEFLLVAKLSDEAFVLAQKHNEMEKYTDVLGNAGTPEEYKRVAQYYESKNDLLNAGVFYMTCGSYPKALELFLQVGESAADKAIELVGKAKQDTLTRQLIDFLMGDTDGIPKDPNYIFRLYMALDNFEQAANTAIIIARQEQELGNYKIAHGILFDTYKDLEMRRIKIPNELKQNLMLLHSYVLAKILMKQKDHMGGARMLTRVAKNISKFPSHIVGILTSTVVECHRAGLKSSAHNFASILVRPEYRNQIDAKYKRQIEQIVRKPDRTEEHEDVEPCPVCSDPLPVTQLDCTSCKNFVPYCIVTVRLRDAIACVFPSLCVFSQLVLFCLVASILPGPSGGRICTAQRVIRVAFSK
eukprot:TRINITY_DN3106_c0_g1_i10.p2 TRINITY_DN3106_c0_g1~~TRINITY_DN3106_c0_g1_i10.p2  ORF type:complete len:1339 (+),score=616.68 TRINITY_DN3106_c0_g1_i10:197-4213(+)